VTRPTTLTLIAASASVSLAASASATLVSVGQTQASVDALRAAGYTDVTNGNPAISTPQGSCAAIGCMSFISVTGDIPLKGFYQFKFLDFTTVNYNGLFGWLQFNYGTSGITQQNIIDSVNAQAPATGVYALTAQQAGHPDCHFSDFLPASMTNSNNVFFNWYPTPAPNTTGLSQLFTFAWDFTNYAPAFTGTGLSITGTGSVPAPGALALLGLAGIGSRRRRA
jgi:MYXO-CTERM domain-containing protein